MQAITFEPSLSPERFILYPAEISSMQSSTFEPRWTILHPTEILSMQAITFEPSLSPERFILYPAEISSMQSSTFEPSLSPERFILYLAEISSMQAIAQMNHSPPNRDFEYASNSPNFKSLDPQSDPSNLVSLLKDSFST